MLVERIPFGYISIIFLIASYLGMETEKKSNLTAEYEKDGLFRILCLDGGGAKGFYTLGVLKEIEGMLGCPLHKRFDLVFGTSTGAIIAALIALGSWQLARR